MFQYNVALKFPKLYPAIVAAYEKSPHAQAHGGIEHDLMVAGFAIRIAPDPTTAKLGAVAALVHSADHLVGKQPAFGSDVPDPELHATEADVEIFVRKKLDAWTTLAPDEKELVLDVVLHHEGANNPNQSVLFQTFVDADRLANMHPSVIMRAPRIGRSLPLIDPLHFENNPCATYRNPGCVIWDIKNCADWADPKNPYAIRLPKARGLALKYAAWIHEYLRHIHEGHDDAGLMLRIVDEEELLNCPHRLA